MGGNNSLTNRQKCSSTNFAILEIRLKKSCLLTYLLLPRSLQNKIKNKAKESEEVILGVYLCISSDQNLSSLQENVFVRVFRLHLSSQRADKA